MAHGTPDTPVGPSGQLAVVFHIMLIDAHNHLQEEVLVPYVEGLIDRARAAGVGEMWCNGTAEDDWQDVLDLATAHSDILPFFGLHPWFVKDRSPDWLTRLEQFLDATPSAIGEIGLDRHLQESDEPAQEEVFRAQLALANDRGLPVTIHCLKAWGWMIEVLADLPSLPPMLIHAYGGSAEVVQSLTARGAFFSFGGSVLDENHLRARAALQAVPLDRLLIETDAPALLPPEPYRRHTLITPDGQTYNEPASLPAIAEGIAQLLGIPSESLTSLTAENAARFTASLPSRAQ
ncbi:MAG: TatD family hydrolase [Armatimonadota bacterium]